MKKLFAIVAVAAALTACNGSGEEKAATTDTSKMAPTTDAAKVDTAASHMMDTAKKMINNATDTMKKAMNDAKDKMNDASKMVDKAKEAVKH